MTVYHKVDSITGIKKKKKLGIDQVVALGKQVTDLSIKDTKKDVVINSLGEQTVNDSLQIARVEAELNKLKKGAKQ